MSNVAFRDGEAETAATESRPVTVAPRVDILETENEFLLVADMPGVKPENVDLGFEQGELTLHGSRPAAFRSKGLAHCDQPARDYQRTFKVSDAVAGDRIAADMKDGVLTVRLPKIEAVKPRKIAVRG
jgi:HSP20 family protein